MGLGGLRWACYHIIITWQRLEQYSKYFSLQSQALPAGVVKIDDLCWFQHGSPHSLLRPNYKTVFNPIATNLNILNLPLKFWVGAPTLSIPIKQLLKVWADHFQWHQWLWYAMRFQVPSNHIWLKTFDLSGLQQFRFHVSIASFVVIRVERCGHKIMKTIKLPTCEARCV